MALEFLTKKRWNPSNTKNREQVWLKEQEVEKEKKKMEELQKQLKEERQRMDLRKVQQKVDGEDDSKMKRVEWLYEMPVPDQAKSEDYLTGKAVFDLYKNEKDQMKDLEEKKVAGATFANGDDDVMGANEIMRRVNEDPLMKMRKLEMEMTKNRLANSQKIVKIAQMLKAKGSDISLDFSSMKNPEKNVGRSIASFEKGLQHAESDSDGSDESDSDNYTSKLMKKSKGGDEKKKTKEKVHRHHRHHSRSRDRSPSHSHSKRDRSPSHSHSKRDRSPSHSHSKRDRSPSHSHSKRDRSPHSHSKRDLISISDPFGRNRIATDGARPHQDNRGVKRVTKEMSNDNMEQRVKQMQEDAIREDVSIREKRLKEEEERYKHDKNRSGEGNSVPVFLAKMNQSAFGDDMSLEKRVSSRRHYQTRD